MRKLVKPLKIWASGIDANSYNYISANDSYFLINATRLTAVIYCLYIFSMKYVDLSAVAQLTGIVTSAGDRPVMQHHSRLLSKSADNEYSAPSTIVISSLITPSATCPEMTVLSAEYHFLIPTCCPTLSCFVAVIRQ